MYAGMYIHVHVLYACMAWHGMAWRGMAWHVVRHLGSMEWTEVPGMWYNTSQRRAGVGVGTALTHKDSDLCSASVSMACHGMYACVHAVLYVHM